MLIWTEKEFKVLTETITGIKSNYPYIISIAKNVC